MQLLNLFQPGIEPVGCAPSTSGGIGRPRQVEKGSLETGIAGLEDDSAAPV
ncbi:hypothetical protein [Mangrovihabitans endophyticus]|nr:hypothetical protein [Mangrovihabitans endophyticus]